MYVVVDDIWQQLAPRYRRAGPDPTSCSDSELITIALVSECRGWDRETHLVAEWQPYRPVRSEDVMYNANCIRVETGFFCQPTKLKSGVEAILRQVSARNYPC